MYLHQSSGEEKKTDDYIYFYNTSLGLGFTETKEKWSYVSRILFSSTVVRNSQLVTQKLSARAAMMERDSVLIDLLL